MSEVSYLKALWAFARSDQRRNDNDLDHVGLHCLSAMWLQLLVHYGCVTAPASRSCC